MRTTVTLDDELLARAEELTGIRERSALIRDAVELLVRIETGRQLIIECHSGSHGYLHNNASII